MSETTPTWAESTWELRAENEPADNGRYVVEVWRDGFYLTVRMDEDRAAAIAKAKAYVDNRRSVTTEVMPL